jgi:hypothetical protein
MSRNLSPLSLNGPSRRPWSLRCFGMAAGWLMFSGAALLIGWLAISRPLPGRKGEDPCEISGMVTSQGRLVARGTIRFSCVMLQADDLESKLNVAFPSVVVSIRDGCYRVSNRDGLVPGSYQVALHPHELGPKVGALIQAGQTGTLLLNPQDHHLIEVRKNSNRVVNFELSG